MAKVTNWKNNSPESTYVDVVSAILFLLWLFGARGVGLVDDSRWLTLRLKMKRLLKRAKRGHKMATKKIPGLLQTHSQLHQMKVLTRIWLAFLPLSNQEMHYLVDFSQARVNGTNNWYLIW